MVTQLLRGRYRKGTRKLNNNTVTYEAQRNGEAQLAGKRAVRPKTGRHETSSKQTKSGPGPSNGLRASEPGPYKGNSLSGTRKRRRRRKSRPYIRPRKLAWPFGGLRASENCYNRAQLMGGGRSEVIWREWNRLRRSGRGFPRGGRRLHDLL